MSERNMINECWECIHKRNVAGNAHIMCVTPDRKMTGKQHGVDSGWFGYPLLFDPVWKTKDCSNFKEVMK
jgi:hypothetical protein